MERSEGFEPSLQEWKSCVLAIKHYDRIELNMTMRNIFVVFILLLLTTCINSSESHTGPELNLSNKEVVSIIGIIDFRQEVYIRKNLTEIKYLILNSPGGDMQFAYNIAIMVKYSNIITVIPKNGVCESACTVIFQAGRERHASKSSSLMYHGVRIDGRGMKAYFEECPSVTNECMRLFEILKAFIKEETLKMFYKLEDYGLKHDVFLLFIKQPPDPDWLKYGNLTGYSDLRFTAEESMQYNAVTNIIEYNIEE